MNFSPPPPPSLPRPPRDTSAASGSDAESTNSSAASDSARPRGELQGAAARQQRQLRKSANTASDDGDSPLQQSGRSGNLRGAAGGPGGDDGAQNDGRDEIFVTLFNEYQQQDGVVTGSDLLDILHESGVEVTDERLRELLGEQYADVDFETAETVLLQLREENRKTNVVSKVAGATDVKASLTITVLQYIVLLLTCSRDPSVSYKIVMPRVVIQPKELLIVSIAFIMLLTGGLIILVLSMLWVQAAETAEETSISRFGVAMGSFITSYDSIFLDKFGAELMDMAAEFSTFEDLRFSNKLERQKLRLTRTARMVAARTDEDTNAEIVAEAQRVASYLQFVAAAESRLPASANATALAVPRLLQLADRLQRRWRIVAIAPSSGGSGDHRVVVDTRDAGTPGGCVWNAAGSASQPPCSMMIPCLAATAVDANAARVHPSTVDVDGRGAVAVSIQLRRSALRVCATLPQTATYEFAVLAAQRVLSTVRVDLRDNMHVDEASVVRAGEGHTAQNPVLNFTSPFEISPLPCYAAGECVAADKIIAESLFTRKATGSAGVRDRQSQIAAVVAAPTVSEVTVALSSRRRNALSVELSKLTEMFSYLNQKRIFELGTTIEVALMLRNETTNAIYQASPFAFLTSCLGPCIRIPASLENAMAGYETKSKGYSITPDYRPEPVMGGFGYGALDVVQVVMLVERDVLEIRGLAVDSLTEMINENNQKLFGSFEVQLVKNMGQLVTRTFDPADACPPSVPCRTVEGFGVVFRGDCRHCSRQARLPSLQVEHLTTPKLLRECQNCSAAKLRTLRDIGYHALLSRSEGGGYVEARDYREKLVLGFHGYNANFSTAFYLKVDRDEVMEPIMTRIYTSLGTSIGMVVFALIVLMVTSRNLIAKIESEWLTYKEHIVTQRKEFGDLVREVLPAHIAEHAMRERFCYAESCNVVVMFTEATNLSARLTENWTPEQFCRLATYVYHVADVIAEHFSLYRIRNIGDITFFTCGLAESFDSTKKKDSHPVMRMLSAATVLHQITSPRFAHFPNRTELFEKHLNVSDETRIVDLPVPNGTLTDRVGFVTMPMFKIGVHFAATTLHVVQTGKTPHFDAVGMSPALASRLMNTCRAGAIHVTDTVKEQCEKLDGEKTFKFSKGKSVITRGRGAVTAHVVEAADISMPQSILTTLGIRFAMRLVKFSEDPKDRADGSIFSANTTTTKSSKSTNSSY